MISQSLECRRVTTTRYSNVMACECIDEAQCVAAVGS